MNSFRIFLCAIVLVGMGHLPVQAEEAVQAPEQKEEGQKAALEVTGTVSGYTNNSISVEYSKDATSASEMLLPFTDRTKLVGVGNIKELQIGDTVDVKYERMYKEGEDGNPIILKTLATDIRLVRRAPPEPELSSSEGVTS